MKNKLILFWVIVLLTIISIATICTKQTKLGLDLVGGSRLVLEAQTTDTISHITPDLVFLKQLYSVQEKKDLLLKYRMYLI